MNPAPALRKKGSSESGQTLLLAITIGLVLLIGIAVIVFVNHAGTLHQTARSLGVKSQGVAEEGMAYAIQELSASSTIWQNALGGTFPSDCTSPNPIIATVSGGNFKLYCSTGTAGTLPIQSFQVAVTVVALASGRTNEPERPVRAIQAAVSRRTLGADFVNIIHAAAALQMVHQPAITSTSPNALAVHWGPIVCLDASQDAANNPSVWTLPTPIDAGRYPRKFSVGGLTGTAPFSRSGTALNPGPDSDQKEYWAHAPIAPPPIIDESAYIQRARNQPLMIPQPVYGGSLLAPTNCVSANCGYFTPPVSGGTVVFDGGYHPLSGSVIYVDGSVEFDEIAMDGVTFIATGALTIKDSTTGMSVFLVVPSSAALEYPYAPASQPCQDQATCLSPADLRFRGFLYVKGNMYVNTISWTMAGSLMVGDVQAVTGTSGMLIIPGTAVPANARMTLYYDDAINHDILVKPVSSTGQIKIAPDWVQNVPAF